MTERPSWLKVVGGTDLNPSKSREAGEDTVSKPQHSHEIQHGELVELWVKITNHLPADYNTATRPERVQEAAIQVQSWTVSELYSYLSQSDIWNHPSFTKATIEEVAHRMRRRNFSPK